MMKDRRAVYAALCAILLAAAFLRFGGTAWSLRFHPDEAWFATFAREAVLRGDWLLSYNGGGALDKPPLAIYVLALSMQFTAVTPDAAGVLNMDALRGEAAARLPAAFAGVITVAAVYALAWRLTRQRWTALIAAGLAALSPYGIAYSAAAFTDGLMATFAALALACAAGCGWRAAAWTGVFVALAFACKSQGIYIAPLCVVLLWRPAPPTASPVWQRGEVGTPPLHLEQGLGGAVKTRATTLVWFLLPLIVGVALVFAWDAARAAALDARGLPTVSIFAQAAVNNDPERASIRADEIAPRLSVWLRFAVSLIGSPFVIFALAVPLALIVRPRWADGLLLLFVVGYFVAHWLLPFNLYDRYLLPLLPPVCVLAARGGVWLRGALFRFLPSAEVTLVMGAIGLSLINGAFNVRAGIVNVGAAASLRRDIPLDPAEGGARDYEGIDEIADYLNGRALGAIVYDRWLGWELGYYMGAWTDKRRVYYPTPAVLAQGAAAQPDPAPRYMVVPLNAPYPPFLEALAAVGFTAERVFQRETFRVYELRRGL